MPPGIPLFSSLRLDRLDTVASLLRRQGLRLRICERRWKEFPYRPSVNLWLGATPEFLLATFKVREKAILARKWRSNQAVCKDSCVEMFLSFRGRLYYNLEFNCIGTCLAGYGQGRHGRVSLDAARIRKIKRQSSLGRKAFGVRQGRFGWELTAAIPFAVFREQRMRICRPGQSLRANFYKCGDHLPEPHYLSWKPVKTPRPDFHQSGYFGRLVFT